MFSCCYNQERINFHKTVVYIDAQQGIGGLLLGKLIFASFLYIILYTVSSNRNPRRDDGVILLSLERIVPVKYAVYLFVGISLWAETQVNGKAVTEHHPATRHIRTEAEYYLPLTCEGVNIITYPINKHLTSYILLHWQLRIAQGQLTTETLPVSLYIYRWEISSFVNLTCHTTNLVQIGLFYLKQRLKWQTDCIAAQIVSTVSDTSVDCLHYHSRLEWNSQLLGMKLPWPKVSILSSYALIRVLCNFYLKIIIVLKRSVNLWFYYLKTVVLTSKFSLQMQEQAWFEDWHTS